MHMDEFDEQWKENATNINLEALQKNVNKRGSALGNDSRYTLEAQTQIAQKAKKFSKNITGINSKSVQTTLAFMPQEVSKVFKRVFLILLHTKLSKKFVISKGVMKIGRMKNAIHDDVFPKKSIHATPQRLRLSRLCGRMAHLFQRRCQKCNVMM